MHGRLELQTMLENLLGSQEVYFQPPASVKMQYPAIVYFRNNIDSTHADDGVYKQSLEYQVIVIDTDPDSEIVMKVSQLPRCRYERHYVSDGLNHDSFILNH